MVVSVIGWPVSAYIGYRLGLRSQRIAREFSAKDSARSRVRGFADSVRQVRAIVANPDPEKWVVYFQQAAPQLQAAFDGVSSDFTPSDRFAVRSIVEEVVAFSRLNPADIYEQQNQIHQKLEGLERCARAT